MARRMLSSSSTSSKYLHLLSQEYYSDGLYSLRRMDASTLFYPSTAKAKAAAAAAARKRVLEGDDFDFHTMEEARLHEQVIHYEPQVEPLGSASEVFARFGGSKILCANAAGHAAVYDADEHCFVGVASMNSPKGQNHVAFPGLHADSVYVLDMTRGRGRSNNNASRFEELAYRGGREGWGWRALPPPPFPRDPPDYPFPKYALVAGGTRIYVPTATATYTFDTASGEWSKAGDWVLPFAGIAEHVPELGVWLASSPDIIEDPYGIYAVDLTAGSPPKPQFVGRDLDPPPAYEPYSAGDPVWSLEDQALVHLGSGRLCVARFFNHYYERYTPALAVFTGVEVVRSGAGDDDGCQAGDHGGLSLIRHKSQCIMTNGTTMRVL